MSGMQIEGQIAGPSTLLLTVQARAQAPRPSMRFENQAAQELSQEQSGRMKDDLANERQRRLRDCDSAQAGNSL